MIFYPAIDLKDGRCVRLVQGDMDRATVFGDDPAAQARVFADAGCEWIHVVDLDGAFAGRPVNEDAVQDVIDAAGIPVQVGGGIRDLDRVGGWLERGAERVVLGTLALSDPDLVRQACRRHPGRVAVGIDARDGRVAVEGWSRDSGVEVMELARAMEDSGAAVLIHTDIARDGVMGGPNIEATAALARAVTVPVIASGGVASLDDIRDLKATGVLAGVICGRALYDGRIDPAEAAALLREQDREPDPC
ncbi:MAG: 1-(5-phosphoribosyl)-5-[(5-phosphoribosylamino)methylideneamino]imidazole-4-carboxamide isomerase [Proteobacteria bacterium]|nr:1-(5-phosphoribosyl)-5-[(5-phosphoribosylamino)methylideneamino]imidazole-4-carboxamide isomerase [Pseudomonadota bacterium]